MGKEHQRRSRLRAHCIAPLPAALGAGLLAAGPAHAQLTTVDDHFSVARRNIEQPLGNVLDNDPGATSVQPFNSIQPRGIVYLEADGDARYLPFPGTCQDSFSFTYLATDGQNFANGLATVELLMPTEPDAFSLPAGTSLDFDVQANDPFGDVPNNLDVVAFSATAGLTQLAPGTTNQTGQFRYQPPAGFSGQTGFVYYVEDPYFSCTSNVATTVDLLVLPNPADDSYATDYATTLCGVNVLENDLPNTLAVVDMAMPAHGAASIAPDGLLCYTPEAGFSGTDVFQYTVSDGTSNASAMVSIEVGNATPVPQDDSVVTAAGQAATGNVLANDSDPDGDPLSAFPASSPANGSLDLAADGSFSYVPAAGFSGFDAFQYAAVDSDGANAIADVQVQVVPVASDDSIATTAGAAASGNLLQNDLGSGLEVLGHSAPANGSVLVNADGSFTYTPAAGFQGSDAFQYTLADSAGQNASATVDIAVGNAAPLAVDDAVQPVAGQPVSGNVLANDSDPDGDALSVASSTAPLHGSASVAADGSFTYTPAPGFSGSDGFDYVLSDGDGGSDSASVLVEVAPRVLDDSFQVRPGDTLSGNVLDNDLGSGLTATLVTPPQHGSLTLQADGSFSYTPEAGFTGTDSFSYSVQDANGTVAVGNGSIVVGGAPAALAAPAVIPALGQWMLALLAAMLGWFGLRQRRDG